MTETNGLSYADNHDLIETIVSMKKKKYNFPGVDPEDTAQDIRIICWEALKKFDSDKVGKSVFHFVARCVDNALYNKFRGVYLDNNPPCLRCEHYIKETKVATGGRGRTSILLEVTDLGIKVYEELVEK